MCIYISCMYMKMYTYSSTHSEPLQFQMFFCVFLCLEFRISEHSNSHILFIAHPHIHTHTCTVRGQFDLGAQAHSDCRISDQVHIHTLSLSHAHTQLEADLILAHKQLTQMASRLTALEAGVCVYVLQYVAVCCSVLQCVAVCCNVLQCVEVC